MTVQIPTREPDAFPAGTTVKWTKSLADYKASDGWSLTYYFGGPSSFKVDATTSGDDFAVTIALATTKTLQPGTYRWVARATLDGESYDVASGTLRVLPDRSKPGDQRTHAERMVAALEAEIEARITGDGTANTGASVNGRQISLMTLEELHAHRSTYKNEVDNVARRGYMASVGVSFGRPR